MSDWLLLLIIPAILLFLHSKWSGKLLLGLASGLKQHAETKALAEWQGNYYKWGDQQIRIVEKDGNIWVVDADLLNAAGLKLDKNLRRKLQISYGGYALIPGTRQYGFSETAVLEFLNGKQARNPEITKLKLWFEREVFFTLQRKREGV
ncbi:MAG: hypothetical protein B7Y56_08235 [Gallionellales bacterium 35-53-114]|jgi:hypothetical protein|nr:MAG: hypothetical protein B7Y56_08235 [Gallionellales bacterium 35-53-114]OYZ62616.1 MAG: hypothetical protein B7Y04_12090 [Gallionellales bacterium 24-53-125]OZB09690.1 MAG: hypothetical protein B7X61_03990 [Gallionellales bacterium 39-52-133]HQS57751.1 hypothetical protein [Gallionellaceae bacterium]HQS74204.1 hypothetical protein [Gallionellaceae bacterium]